MDTPLRILIADDHPIVRRGLCDVIRSDDGLQLIGEADDGEAALNQMRVSSPDIAILDVTMPQQSGLQLARTARKEGLAARIILLTMHEDEDLLNEALRIPVDAYVLKETAVEELLAAIQCVSGGGTFISARLAAQVLARRNRTIALHHEKPGLESLTSAEQRILRLVADDQTSKEIASHLNCSVRTVETHRQNISTKLGLHGSHSLLKFAYHNKSRL